MKKHFLLLIIFCLTFISCTVNKNKYKAVYINELSAKLDIFPSVFSPSKCSKLVAKNMAILVKNQDTILDSGTGTGLWGLIGAKQGAEKIISTDINPKALENLRHNAKKLGFEEKFETRLVTKETGFGVFDVIKKHENFDIIVPFHFHNDLTSFNNFLKEVKNYLKPTGVALIRVDKLNKKSNEIIKDKNLVIGIIDKTDIFYSCDIYLISN